MGGRESEWYHTGCSGSQDMRLCRMCVACGLCCAVGLCPASVFVCFHLLASIASSPAQSRTLRGLVVELVFAYADSCLCRQCSHLDSVHSRHNTFAHDELSHNTCPKTFKFAPFAEPAATAVGRVEFFDWHLHRWQG